jgi:hypothetical protein
MTSPRRSSSTWWLITFLVGVAIFFTVLVSTSLLTLESLT